MLYYGFMSKTVVVRGESVFWPDACSCCSGHAETTRRLARTYSKTSTQYAPICEVCLAHVKSSGSRRLARYSFIVVTALVLALVYSAGVVWFRSELARFFDIRESDLWMLTLAVVMVALIALSLLAMSVMNRSDEDLQGRMTANCSNRDGGVLYTGFVYPTPLNPDIAQPIHRFTFLNDAFRERFELANAGRCEQDSQTDKWDAPL